MNILKRIAIFSTPCTEETLLLMHANHVPVYLLYNRKKWHTFAKIRNMEKLTFLRVAHFCTTILVLQNHVDDIKLRAE
jgi:hypothetical protein